jgi:hypothetical protein
VLTAALLARELGFCYLVGAGENHYQHELQHEAPHASKFILVASDYLRRAARLPSEFTSLFSDRALKLGSGGTGSEAPSPGGHPNSPALGHLKIPHP